LTRRHTQVHKYDSRSLNEPMAFEYTSISRCIFQSDADERIAFLILNMALMHGLLRFALQAHISSYIITTFSYEACAPSIGLVFISVLSPTFPMHLEYAVGHFQFYDILTKSQYV